MGGICAIVNVDGRPVPRSHLERMIAAAPYRGRDGVAHWSDALDDHAAISYQATNVTPESLGEKQPLHDIEADHVLAADARIDNRAELLAALTEDVDRQAAMTYGADGVLAAKRSRTRSDAEVVLGAMRRWGQECGAHLIGDFAFVAYARSRRTLIAARDPMGMRPLFYRAEAHRVLIASEVGQILAAPGVPRRADEAALASHLLGDFEDVGRTSYEGIRQVPPGHVLVVSDGQPHVHRYCDAAPTKRIRHSDPRDYAEELRSMLSLAVQSRLRSVRPVGIQLSGGMDSGAIAATAGKLIEDGDAAPPGLHAYSWAFQELSQVDERHVSDQIVRRYGLEKCDVAADDLWPLRDYPCFGPGIDDPFMGVYQVLLEHAAERAATDGVGVMLAGNRGDLVIGDSIHDHLGLLLAGQWSALRKSLHAYGRRTNVPLMVASRRLIAGPLLDEMLSPAWASPLRRRVRARRAGRHRNNATAPIPDWIPREFLDRLGGTPADAVRMLPPEALNGVARRARYRSIFLGMQMKVLVWYERLLAKAGISMADPWSDRRIAEFVLAIPQWVVQRVDEPKALAREAMRGVMPEGVRTAVAKVSPEPLFRRALEHRARATIVGLTSDMRSAARGLVDEHRLRAHYDEILAGAQDAPGFWWALTLEMWLRQHEPS